MKSIYLFCTRLLAFWMLIPLAVLLVLCFVFNGSSAGVLQLYPLIVITICAIIFVFIYFARFINISYAAVKYVGPFTSKDKAIVKKDRRLIIRIEPKRIIRIYLLGSDGPCDFSWLKNKAEDGEQEQDDKPSEIYLFRGKTYGGKSKVRRILRYFSVPKADMNELMTVIGYKNDYELVAVSNAVVNDSPEIYIHIKETV